MNDSIRHFAACLVLMTQLVVVWLGGSGAASCLGCGAETVQVAAAADDDEGLCCCGDSCCGCCTEHARVPGSPAKPPHGECLSCLVVPPMAADTLRLAAADQMRDVQLPVAADLHVVVLPESRGAVRVGLPPPDPGPMRCASGVSITVLLI